MFHDLDIKIKIEDPRMKEDSGISKKELKVKKKTKIKEEGDENLKFNILDAMVQSTDIEVAEILIDAVFKDDVEGSSFETMDIAAKLSEEMKVGIKQVEEKEPAQKPKSKSKKKSKDVKKESELGYVHHLVWLFKWFYRW